MNGIDVGPWNANWVWPRQPLCGKAVALMGALEAPNGMLLFGLTTAFLFAMIQKVWPLGTRRE